jgi:hypothetical protein
LTVLMSIFSPNVRSNLGHPMSRKTSSRSTEKS